MFPIPWNKAFRKKDGTVVNIEDAMGGGGGSSELPDYSAEDAGKVLGVTEEGQLAWVEVTGGGNFRNLINVSSLAYNDPEAEEVTT